MDSFFQNLTRTTRLCRWFKDSRREVDVPKLNTRFLLLSSPRKMSMVKRMYILKIDRINKYDRNLIETNTSNNIGSPSVYFRNYLKKDTSCIHKFAALLHFVIVLESLIRFTCDLHTTSAENLSS